MHFHRVVLAIGGVCLLATYTASADENGSDGRLAPIFVNCPESTLYREHCDTLSFKFRAVDPFTGMPSYLIRYHLISGPGAIDSITGEWSYITTAADVPLGVQTVEVAASKRKRITTGLQNCRLRFESRNNPPVIYGSCCAQNDVLKLYEDSSKTLEFHYQDDDLCDTVSTFVKSIAPDFNGILSLDHDSDTVYLTIAPDSGDRGKSFTLRLGFTDHIDTVYREVNFRVYPFEGYKVRIDKIYNALQGQVHGLNILLDEVDPQEGIGSFDVLIGYDNSALALQGANVTTSPLYSSCKWEYFTYRFGPPGDCASCPSGLVRAVGLAETNNGTAHPVAGCPSSPLDSSGIIMFSLDFLLSNAPELECQFIPVRFFWMDCGNNSIANFDGSRLYIASRVFDYYDSNVPIDSTYAKFPGWGGVPSDSCKGPFPNKPAPAREIDFLNGGIDVMCAESVDVRGDINLNGLPYEIADAIMFEDYFTFGLAAFGDHAAGSTAASDVNADGIPLTVADYACLVKRAVGEGQWECPTSPVAAHLVNKDGTLSVDVPLSIATFAFRGTVIPQLLAAGVYLQYAYHDSNTYVLVHRSLVSGQAASFSGDFLKANGEIISLSMASADGAPVVVDNPTAVNDRNNDNLPATFALHQNYPNPFNGGTTVGFDLPRAAEVQFDVVNILGEVVYAISQRFPAGRHQVQWDGTSNGRTAASGVYYYRLRAGEFTSTKKMMLLK